MCRFRWKWRLKKMPNKKEIEKDVRKYAGLESLSNTAGGKDLIAYLQSGFVSAVDMLISKYKSGKTDELIPLIAAMDEKLNLLRTLTRASKNKELALTALKEEEKRIEDETS